MFYTVHFSFNSLHWASVQMCTPFNGLTPGFIYQSDSFLSLLHILPFYGLDPMVSCLPYFLTKHPHLFFLAPDYCEHLSSKSPSLD